MPGLVAQVVYPRSREVHAWQAAGFEAASVYKGLRNAVPWWQQITLGRTAMNRSQSEAMHLAEAGLREGWGVLNQNDGSTYAGQWVSGRRRLRRLNVSTTVLVLALRRQAARRGHARLRQWHFRGPVGPG